MQAHTRTHTCTHTHTCASCAKNFLSIKFYSKLNLHPSKNNKNNNKEKQQQPELRVIKQHENCQRALKLRRLWNKRESPGGSRPPLSTAFFSYFAIIFFFCGPPSTSLSLPLCALFILPMPAQPCYKQNGTKWRHLLLQIRKIRCFIKNEMSEANAKGANTHTHPHTHTHTHAQQVKLATGGQKASGRFWHISKQIRSQNIPVI